VITPEGIGRHYSTRLRTAVVLAGSGTAGAYHAGVLRAFHEAGVKIDLAAGRGIGAIGAFFTAMDGGARLWEDAGLWRSPGAADMYGWRASLRWAGWGVVAAFVILAVPLALLVVAVAIGLVGMLLTLVGLGGVGSAMTVAFSRWVAALFAPAALPTIIPRLVLFAALCSVAALVAGAVMDARRARSRRRTRRGWIWRLIGTPFSSSALLTRSASELWNLIRGAAPLKVPPSSELATRYVELLGENVGQPGFRDLLVAVHDMDAGRDVVFAVLGQAHRQRFFTRSGSTESGARDFEAFNLSGAARAHAMDALAAALAIPVATPPHLVTFHPEGPWRGETHRLCDRPGGLTRLLEEVAAAGAEQIILVTASPVPSRAHEMSAGRADLRGRAGEPLAAFEAASVRDALELFAGRFAGLFVVRPAHNPLGPFDFAGVYDERSDRAHTLGELLDRGYEDAYRQFIEPVVGAGTEPLERVQ
jgi:hypothetical protein